MAKLEQSSDRASDIQAMLSRIPIDLLEETGLRLLKATRHVSQGRDLPMVEEPDNAIQAKIWLACVEQGAGAAPTRKPIEAAAPESDAKPSPGLLKQGKGKAL